MERRIDIGDKSYRLRYSLNAMCEMERAAGCPLEQMVEKQFSAARLLLWGALIDLQPEISIAEAGRMMDAYMRAGGTIEDVINICYQAMEDAGFFAQAAM